MTKPLQNDDLAKLLMRLAVGGLMLFHGVHKVANGIGGIEGMLSGKGLPEELAWGVHLGYGHVGREIRYWATMAGEVLSLLEPPGN